MSPGPRAKVARYGPRRLGVGGPASCRASSSAGSCAPSVAASVLCKGTLTKPPAVEPSLPGDPSTSGRRVLGSGPYLCPQGHLISSEIAYQDRPFFPYHSRRTSVADTASRAAIPRLDARLHKHPLETNISGMTAHQYQPFPIHTLDSASHW